MMIEQLGQGFFYKYHIFNIGILIALLSNMRKAVLISLGIVLAILTGCGSANEIDPNGSNGIDRVEKYTGSAATMPNIKFTSTMAASDRRRLEKDFEFLTTILISSSNGVALQKDLDISDTNPQSIVNWLNDRVQYLVDKDLDFYKATQLFDMSHTSGISDQSSTMVAVNIGAAIFQSADKAGKIAEITLPGIGTVRIRSPRTGIIQQGDGLLMDLTGTIDSNEKKCA